MLIENPETLSTFEIPKKEETNLKTYYLYFLWYNETLVYIGQTVDLNSRTTAHKKDKHFNKVTYQVFMGITKEEILKIETTHIRHFKPSFNNNEKGIVKTPTCVLQRGGSIFELNKLYNYKSESYYYDGNVLQSIRLTPRGYIYFEDGKQKEVINNLVYNTVTKVNYYIENNLLKCKFQYQEEQETKEIKTNKKLVFAKGKYKGKLFSEISRKDKSYVNWMKNNVPNYMITMMK